MLKLIVAGLIALASTGALADAKAGEKKAQLCVFCHRVGGMGAPLLEAQPAGFLAAALAGYKSGKRTSPSMDPNVAKLTKRDIAELAAYFASRPLPAHGQPMDAAKAVAGEVRVKELGCAECHGQGFAGVKAVPRLAGQSPVYLAMELDSIVARRRAHPAPMATGVDIESIAHYFGGLN